MKKYIIVISLFLYSCSGYNIEQNVEREDGIYRICEDGALLSTIVWKRKFLSPGDIVWSAYDCVNTMPDSTKIKRRLEAKAIIKKLTQ